MYYQALVIILSLPTDGVMVVLIINDFFLSTMLLRLSINEMFKPSSRDF